MDLILYRNYNMRKYTSASKTPAIAVELAFILIITSPESYIRHPSTSRAAQHTVTTTLELGNLTSIGA